MNNNVSAATIGSWLFALVVLTIAVLNMILVHPVPGVVFLLLACLYLPPANALLWQRFHISIPLLVKIILGVFIIWFTLGVSDLGDMID